MGGVMKLSKKDIAIFKEQFKKHNGDIKKVSKSLKKSVSTIYTRSIELGLRSKRENSERMGKLATTIEKLSKKSWHAGAIAEKLNEPIQKIQRISRIHGITLVRKKHVLKHTPEKLISCYKKSDGSYTTMSRKMGIANSSVSTLMKKHGLSKKYPATHARN